MCKEKKEDDEFYVSDWICKVCRKIWNHERYSRKRVELMLSEEPFATLVSKMEELSTENRALKSKLKKYCKEQTSLHDDLREEISADITKEVKKAVKHRKREA